ncbi:helix-turn-helix domain-containing protein [Paenibacillus sp. 32352]|uniref:helix-turn-helix domain-containing protein n=1 Tax=Paenibacillus sp. 32352 TaxID=1969111 RepID=UPI0009ABD3C5|nr:helix-turn-helix domain-containing protein [Paenibacillus sp. 32352]
MRDEKVKTMSYADSVQRAIDYIEERLDQELDLTCIAEEAYLSVAQLYRVFYALTGHPVKDYIRKRRISVAAHQLRNTDRTVEELAWESGFESYHSFAKVFKKIVGLTPASYRKAELFFSFEPIRLHDQISYTEDREQTERFPDVKVIRLLPGKMYSYLHIADHEEGMENEAFRIVGRLLSTHEVTRDVKSKLRIFGHNVELTGKGQPRKYGYKVLIADTADQTMEDAFTGEPFAGGLYAVRRIPAACPKTVQDAWDRLLSEWLPKSTFDIGTHQYIEEFIAYNDKVTRMNLYLPVQRKLHPEPIEIVELGEIKAFFCRGDGAEAQKAAEMQLIDWHTNVSHARWRKGHGKYYMSYHYGAKDTEDYWWENGILSVGPEAPALEGLKEKRLGSGTYACCVSKTYGLLTGVLDKMHRWIIANDSYRLDEERQWFAEYHLIEGSDLEQDTVVKVYIPISKGGGSL